MSIKEIIYTSYFVDLLNIICVEGDDIMNTSRHRLDEFRYQRRSVADHGTDRFLKKTVSQLIACFIIFAVVFAITKIDSPQCKKVTESINNSLRYHVDYIGATKSIFAKIKEIPNMFMENKNEKESPTEETDTPPEEQVQSSEQDTQDEAEKGDEDATYTD
jgi:large-conductance mechanosensitive channel